MTDLPLVLASSSPFRRALLEKLGMPFACDSPDIDEQAQPDESPQELVMRLAKEKAEAVAERHPRALIIGSDQVALRPDGVILGKPGNHGTAVAQLQSCNGATVRFLTGLCLLNSETGRHQLACEVFQVHFRTLKHDTIERYLEREKPYNCAGSFKSEGLGITLFKALEGRDPNALIGLPLILLTDFLRIEGVGVP